MDFQNLNDNNIKSDFKTTFDNLKNESDSKVRLGPLNICKDRIDLLGFSFAIDDLIIIALILILFFDSDSNFVLLIVLCLILFNVSFSNLSFFNK